MKPTWPCQAAERKWKKITSSWWPFSLPLPPLWLPLNCISSQICVLPVNDQLLCHQPQEAILLVLVPPQLSYPFPPFSLTVYDFATYFTKNVKGISPTFTLFTLLYPLRKHLPQPSDGLTCFSSLSSEDVHTPVPLTRFPPPFSKISHTTSFHFSSPWSAPSSFQALFQHPRCNEHLRMSDRHLCMDNCASPQDHPYNWTPFHPPRMHLSVTVEDVFPHKGRNTTPGPSTGHLPPGLLQLALGWTPSLCDKRKTSTGFLLRPATDSRRLYWPSRPSTELQTPDQCQETRVSHHLPQKTQDSLDSKKKKNVQELFKKRRFNHSTYCMYSR